MAYWPSYLFRLFGEVFSNELFHRVHFLVKIRQCKIKSVKTVPDSVTEPCDNSILVSIFDICEPFFALAFLARWLGSMSHRNSLGIQSSINVTMSLSYESLPCFVYRKTERKASRGGM